jgi:flagellar biosynthesis protein FlhB
VARAEPDATEEPTPRRLAEARRRGDVAFSRELGAAAAGLAAVAVLVGDGPGLAARAVATLRAALASAPNDDFGRGASASLAMAGTLGARTLAPALGAALLVSVAAGLAQTRGLVLAPVRVDLGRLGSTESWRRLFDGRAALAVGQGLLKVVLVGAVAALALRPLAGAIVGLTEAPPGQLLGALGAFAGRLALRLAAVGVALGAGDALLVARRHRRGLRMTREEVKREHRESDGDPTHRGERQRLHREILEQRRVEEVRKADFVVVNPEHIAVALRYDPDGDAAPVVVAKGERLVAERIKQIAREAGVPIFRDVGLARALAELAEGGEIPAELYEAVAEILRVVQGLQQGLQSPQSSKAGSAPAGAMQTRAPTTGRSGWKRV